MNFINKIGNFIDTINDRFTNYIFALLVFPLIAVVVTDVMFRYFFQIPIPWAYDMTWMFFGSYVFLGGGYVLHKDKHVRIDILFNMLPKKWKKIVNLICYLIFFFPSVIGLVYATYKLMIRAWIIGEKASFTSWAPLLWPIKMVLFLSMTLLLLQGFVEFVRYVVDFMKGDNEK